MATKTITIDSILGGISSNLYQGGPGQFVASIGIDPDQAIDGGSSGIKTSGALVPSSYTKFSSTILTSAVNWIITNTKDSNIYVLCTNGRFISYSSTFGSETLIGTIGGGAGNGAAYYANYIYLVGTTDISRYGPLDGTATLTDGVWTGTTLGSQTALGNATYPTLRNIAIPSNPMFVHSDNKLYVGDYETANVANKGRGKVHWIRTTISAGNVEGATNNGTTQNALYLPFGYAPTAFASWGNDLVIAAIPMSSAGASATIIQGKAALFFWDAVNAPSLPYKMVPLVDPLVTALLNHNGHLFIWSGNANNGIRVSEFAGGYSLRQLAFFEEGISPNQGNVDGLGNRIVWGAFTTYPENSASVYSLGYKDGNLPFALHNIINTEASDTASAFMVTAIKAVQHASFISPRFVVAWKDKDSATTSSNFGLDRLLSTARTAVWRSLTYAIGTPFRIKKITIPLGAAVAANMTLIATIGVDDYSTTTAQTTINNTNYAGSQRRIIFYPDVTGNNNFQLQLRWTGTAILAVTLPIEIEVEIFEDVTG